MSGKSEYNLLTILGPTATGKTRVAAELAAQIHGEIISADSRQIYRQMNLGTGKDYKDYLVDNKKVPYHLIDIHDPGYKYNVFEYQKDFLKVYTLILKRNNIPILCGGSGLYIQAVLNAYKLIAVPVNYELREKLKSKSLEELEAILAGYRKLHNKTDTDTKKRAIRAIEIEEYYCSNLKKETNFPKIKSLLIGIKFDRDTRRRRITERLHARIKEGMIDEVKVLMEQGLSQEDLMYYGLEYKYVTLYLTGKLSLNEMTSKLNIAIHQFAKRQMTWFRKMEREGAKINWLNGHLPMNEKLSIIRKLWSEKSE